MMHLKMKNLFEPVPGCHFELRGAETKDTLEDLFASGEYQVTEEKMIHALYDYRFLNRYNLTRLVNRGDLKRHIDKMLAQGVIEEFVLINSNGNREENSPVAYQLSQKTDQYMQKTKIRGYRRGDKPADDEIYKILSINQYHIGMVLGNKDRISFQKVHFVDTYRDMGTIQIPSLIVLKNRLSLIALPMARNDEDFTTQVRTLLKLAGYLNEKKKEHAFPVIIWVACSNRAVKEGMERVKRIKELKGMPIYFVLDYNTKSGNPIHQICSLDIKDHNRTEINRIIL